MHILLYVMEGKDIKFVDLMLPIMRFYIGYADEGT